ncbi:3-hydroxyisobutyrate dehydrogenase-like beta-hydroxyacid dehydrogenase [Caballeronia udeis]|uniref:3-hydroxyisobutyrate dehydrogenase-like beta-hydroxyacid dehydrogenase n=1 Tax=Caballeronia udeis TaxID=1232866 RepID=A0ABW8MCE2_9BURK
MNQNSNHHVKRIAIVGFGEVGPVFARALSATGREVSVFDIKLQDNATRATVVQRVRDCGAEVAENLASALRDAQLVFSAVTASQAEAVAMASAEYLTAGQTFLDLNSVSPAVKQRNSKLIERNGADYVEAAVMAPVPPQGMRVPILLGGRIATQTAEILNSLGMRTDAVAQEVGLASAIKLCRSIMIKGMEALCVESMLAAAQFGVDGRVLASLGASFPGMGWDSGYESYLIGRVVEHGQRRSEEMREAGLMLDGLGMSSALANAVADVQRELAARTAPLIGSLDAKGSLPEWRSLLSH